MTAFGRMGAWQAASDEWSAAAWFEAQGLLDAAARCVERARAHEARAQGK